MDRDTIIDVSTIVAQTVVERMREPNAASVVQSQAPQPADSVRDALKYIKDTKQLMAELMPEQKEPVQPAQAEKPLEEKIVTLALDHLLKKEDSNGIDMLLSRYLGPPKEEFNWKEIIAEIAKPILPVLAAMMMRQITQPGRPEQALTVDAQPPLSLPATGPQQLAQPPIAAPAGVAESRPQASADSQQPAPQQSLSPGERAYNKVIRRLVEDMIDNASIDASIYSIDDLVERFPESAPYVDMLVELEPLQVLAMLSGMGIQVDWSRVPHAEQWLSNLQTEWVREDDERDAGESEGTEKLEQKDKESRPAPVAVPGSSA